MTIPAFRRAVSLASLCLFFTAGQALAALPPEAQAAVDKGVLAAKEQEWDIAIQSFQEARKTAPNAPEVFYNLGLAESKIPGRELRAIAWFGAYLAAAPHASNVATVKTFIAGLQVKNEGNLNRLIQSLQDQANQMPLNNGDDQAKEQDLIRVGALWAETGDMSAAQKIVDLMPDPDRKVMALIAIAEGQVHARDSKGAQQTLVSARHTADQTQTASWHFGSGQTTAYVAIAKALAQAGDIASARATLVVDEKAAESIQSPNEKVFTQLDIAKNQTHAGDIIGAQATLMAAQVTRNLISYAVDKVNVDTQIAIAQAQTGDHSSAQKAVESALSTFELIQANDEIDANGKSISAHEIATAQVSIGDIAGALRTAGFISDPMLKDGALRNIGYAQITANDYAGAKQTNDSIKLVGLKVDGAAMDPSHHESYADHRPRIVDGEIQSPDYKPDSGIGAPIQSAVEVSDWLKKLDDTYAGSECPLNTDPFLNLTAYLKKLPSSSGPEELFFSYSDAAKKFAAAKNIIDQMLRQQAKQQETS